MDLILDDTATLAPDDLKRAAEALEDKAFSPRDAHVAAFLEQYAADAVADDLEGLSLADDAELARSLWLFGQDYHEGEPALVRLRPAKTQSGALGRDVVDIVQHDKPFLVDSVMGEIAERGHRVRAMFHPVIEIDGKRLSLIQVHLDPIIGEDRREGLVEGLHATLGDVDAAVSDWRQMRARMETAIHTLENAKIDIPEDERQEALEFLRWMRSDHFVFLGAREYDYKAHKAKGKHFNPGVGVGVLRDSSRFILRRAHEPAYLTPKVERFMTELTPVVVAKSNLKSRVHRRAYMDFVGVRRFDEDGTPIGEVRFVGLFTAEAYDRSVKATPLIRQKIARVMEKAARIPGSHSEKKLQNILENYPRDELFQMSSDELLTFALGIVHLLDRPRPRLFLRVDRFDRFASALVFIPRDRFTAETRHAAAEILRRGFKGRISAVYPGSGEGPLAHMHVIIGFEPGEHETPDARELERQITEACETWQDRFETAARQNLASAVEVIGRYRQAFSAGYREKFSPDEALKDIAVIERMGDQDVAVRAYSRPTDPSTRVSFKFYRKGQPAPLADILPILENMGLRAMVEAGYAINRMDAYRTDAEGHMRSVWVHEFELASDDASALDVEVIREPFEQAFKAVWLGETENDGFNRLILRLGINWREAALMRGLCRYRQQTGLDPSQGVQEQALADTPEITRLILDMFAIRFDPHNGLSLEERQKQTKEMKTAIRLALEAVSSLDTDRVLRRLSNLVAAIARTNFYQNDETGQPKTWISFKIKSQEIADLPLPKPYREIFVSAPNVDGVHCRFGPVARGGLRWSDRRDDFRTEVLGLVKAQQVKNAVIVPVGAKGCFYPKRLPKGGTREEIQAEAIDAYQTFLRGLLDITDNLDEDGQVVHPQDVAPLDGEDPYLVVAADKGTATFSDIANALAVSYGFWLGDAFASGGSVGYDHKVMGITARGAWEAVKRHFRELGKDIQSEPFDVIGIGDMSGDVFGNGMLLSKAIRLQAAFDHRHIFIDPNPNPGSSWDERKRLFELPRSTWEDYNPDLISKGGGVFSRSLKRIDITPEMQETFGIEAKHLTPQELIHALLKAPCELLYFGGIGTYIKASHESHHQVGDKTNDGLRVDATQLKAKVIGEGANLGLTQAARIEFARHGGRVNTDAIDNSAGVDSSDHEVNIKILVDQAIRSGTVKDKDRQALLASMTDDVAELVLKTNYNQTLGISLMEMTAAHELEAYERLMIDLERQGKLNREVEGLPSAEKFRELASNQQGLTRPEISVIQAYAKIVLFDEIVASDAPDDPYFHQTLKHYFPTALHEYEDAQQAHRLRREIIATVLTNAIVNVCGATFPMRLRGATHVDAGGLTVAFTVAYAIFRLGDLFRAVHALDGKIPSDAQLQLYQDIVVMLRRQAYWLARRMPGAGVEELIDTYRSDVDRLRTVADEYVAKYDRNWVESRIKTLVGMGAPEALARQISSLKAQVSATDVIDIAHRHDHELVTTAHVYHALGSYLQFDRLRAAAGRTQTDGHFERQAVRRVIEDLLGMQRALTSKVLNAPCAKSLRDGNAATALDVVKTWAMVHQDQLQQATRVLDELEASRGGWSFAKLSIAAGALRELAAD